MSTDEEKTSFDISDDEFIEPCENLLKHLTINHLEKLHSIFKPDEETNVELTKETFVDAIDTILGNSKYSMPAVLLFNEITSEESITWSQLLDYYIRNGITEEINEFNLIKTKILKIPHVERESIKKIVLLETDTWFSYAIISKFGSIGLYTGDLLKLLTSYQLTFTKHDQYFRRKYIRRKNTWVTNACFLHQVKILVVCTSVRSMVFYDASGQKHTGLWLIEDIPNSIQCLDYNYDKKLQLFLGDDFGTIFVLTFQQPTEGLFRKKINANNKFNTFYWNELFKETDYVRINVYKNVHSNTIRSLIYYPEIFSLVSCSCDNKNSILFFNLKERKSSQIFKVEQGVNCFTLSHKLHILITGNNSGQIQIWNLFITTKPLTVLKNKYSIVDVQIFEHKNAAISCDKKGVLKVWDLNEYKCQQIIHLNFPSFQILGKKIEWASSTFYPGPKTVSNLTISTTNTINNDNMSKSTDPWQRKTILVTCCNHVAVIRVNHETDIDNEMILTSPPLQNDVLIPDGWNIGRGNDTTIQQPYMRETIKEYSNPDLELLKFNYFQNNIPKQDIYSKLDQINQQKKEQMIKLVLQCAPYTTLDLYNVNDIQLSQDLPVPNCRRTQQVAERTQRLLSAASNVSIILSDRSSKSKSSRSSVVEF